MTPDNRAQARHGPYSAQAVALGVAALLPTALLQEASRE
jgi:hypothetical protein